MRAFSLLCLAAAAATTNIPYPPSWSKGFESPSVSYSQGGNAICISGKVPITASANGTRIDIPQTLSQFQVTEYILEFLTNSGKLLRKIGRGPQTISGTFKIAVTLCVPKDLKGGNLKTLQILNHGLGSDKNYWDIAPGYSYVDTMAKAGYATLNYVPLL